MNKNNIDVVGQWHSSHAVVSVEEHGSFWKVTTLKRENTEMQHVQIYRHSRKSLLLPLVSYIYRVHHEKESRC